MAESVPVGYVTYGKEVSSTAEPFSAALGGAFEGTNGHVAVSGGTAPCVSCQVVYGDPLGSCHLQLPVFVDGSGACHVSLSPASDIQDPNEASRVLSHICLATCSVPDEARRSTLKSALERALSRHEEHELHDINQSHDSHRRRFLQGALARLGSFDKHSAEAKDALRRSIISKRKAITSAKEGKVLKTTIYFLTYTS